MRCTSEVYAVLLAAGLGTRMGQNKLALRFQGKTPLRLCYEAFLRSQCPPKGIVIAVSQQTRSEALALAAEDARVWVAQGGATRGASVCNALRALQARGIKEGVVAIHADPEGLSLARLVQDIRAQHVTPPGTDPEAPLLRAGNHQVEGRFPGREIEGFRR